MSSTKAGNTRKNQNESSEWSKIFFVLFSPLLRADIYQFNQSKIKR